MRLIRWVLFAQLTLGAVAVAQQGTMPPLPPISDPPTGEHLPGKFVWADLFSNDTEKSRMFYEQVFGWAWKAIRQPPESYGIFYLQETPVAGLAYREAPDGGDSYGRWVHYISVAHVGTTEDAVQQRGGRSLLQSRSFSERGDFAILSDLESAPFGVMHSSSGDPGDYRAAFNEWIWHELFTRDPEKAIRFYSELFGYEPETDTRHPEIMQHLLRSQGYLRAGVGSLSPKTEAAPTWLGYIRVDDIKAATTRARDHGGSVLLAPKTEIADGGLAIIADPTGATIGLLQWDYEDAGRETRP